jgi:hypothetical protein
MHIQTHNIPEQFFYMGTFLHVCVCVCVCVCVRVCVCVAAAAVAAALANSHHLTYVYDVTIHLSLLPLPKLPFHTTCNYLSKPLSSTLYLVTRSYVLFWTWNSKLWFGFSRVVYWGCYACCIVFSLICISVTCFSSFQQHLTSILFSVCNKCGAFLNLFLSIIFITSGHFSFLCLCYVQVF